MEAQPRPLTAKEKKVLQFIESYLSLDGIAPSFKEIKDHFGFKSFNSVQRYLKQLQQKNYIFIPPGNQKRAINLLHPSSAVKSSITDLDLSFKHTNAVSNPKTKASLVDGPRAEALSLPLLGRVAAGQPIEALDHDEFLDVPASLVRNSSKSFALRVEGQSMIEDGIFDGDIILVQEQLTARNGEIVVADVDNEATVKRFYLHNSKDFAQPQVELRPANSELEPMWFHPKEVKIRGIVVGLIRQF